jgi:acyl-coenzyme A synthetase/AMP-(fatty) acid ligase/thioesterase domain-containing protein
MSASPAVGGGAIGLPTIADSVGSALARVADEFGASLAVASTDLSLTYTELTRRSEACAQRLVAAVPADAAPQAPIALLGTPSASLVVAMVAVLLTGRPLVVLDSQLPTGRLQQIQEQARAAVCVTEAALRERAAALEDVPVLVDLADAVADPGSLVSEGAARPAVRVDAHGTGTIVFTSGSTGRPKGVLHSHGLIITEAMIMNRYLGIGPGQRLALVLPPSFSLGEHAVFGALLTGASLHVYDPRVLGLRGLPSWLRQQRVTAISLTPSLLRALSGSVAPGEPLTDLRVVASAGEALQGADVLDARERLGPVTVVNGLGSSETAQISFLPIGPDHDVPAGPVSVGPPVAEKEVLVLGPDGRPVPDGETGVLRIQAPFLAAGYLGVPDTPGSPFGVLDDGRRTFTMSDRVRRDATGALQTLGRADDAVKVRGYLVQPAEVETALRSLDGVADAVVVGVRDGSTAALVAYVAPNGTVRTPSAAQLRRALLDTLPSWMVPADLVLLDELPRTERGKVDRAALPAPTRPEPEPPQGAWEETVAALFASVLGRKDVGRGETFTALGGDSLAVEELLTRLHEQHGVQLTTAAVAEAASVAELAPVVAAAVGDQQSSPSTTRRGRRRRDRHTSVVTLRAGGSRPPVMCFTGAGAGGQAFLHLADALGDDQPVHAFQPHGLEEWALPDLTIGMAARRHLRELRRLQRHGPYRLVGHSMGGLIALEVARRLLATGEEVSSVVLIDTVVPPNLTRRQHRVIPTAPSARRPAGEPAGQDVLDDEPGGVELWRRRGQALLSGFLPHLPGRPEHIRELGVRVSLLHRPHRWSGPAAVYLSHLNEDDPEVWQKVLTGSVHFEVLHGDHNSLLRTPHIQTIARHISGDVVTPHR